MIKYHDDERLTFDEYLDFLRRTDLGSQYPKQRFSERITQLLDNVDICITARNADGLLVGVCLGLTDFVYFLFLTDLGVDRTYVKRGIGRQLVALAHENAGGKADITITAISNDDAIGFYKTCKMTTREELVVKYCEDWESFEFK